METSGAFRAGLTQDHRVSDIVRDVMSPCPRILAPDATLVDAALVMRREDIGDVLVCEEGDRLLGIVTDRDIVVRALAEGAIRPRRRWPRSAVATSSRSGRATAWAARCASCGRRPSGAFR
jgi:signal-transduction protein with cAMP-binding, CBS, and nucleotidyltransferase domain